MDVQLSDLVTVGLLVIIEGLLSADNALVMAVMILGLPRLDQKKALRYGLIGAFGFRIVATMLAAYLIQISWVKLFGGIYLLYLAQHHFFASSNAEERSRPKPARAWLGLPALWATVVKVELVNLAFSIDSILVAVAMSPKFWVILTGGLLGIVAMRVVVGQLLALSFARRRRLCHHRVDRAEAPDGVPPRDWRYPLRGQQVGLVRPDRRDLYRRVPVRAQQGSR